MAVLDLLARWVPILAEPGDAVTVEVTVPSGYEATVGAWTAFVWRNKQKGTPVATFDVGLAGQVVTVSLTSATTAGLVPSGASAFSGWWELDRTVSSTARTWLKGDFILDPARRSSS